MKNIDPLLRRTWISFAVGALMFALGMGTWAWMMHQPEHGLAPAPFRRMLELNGRLWKALSRPQALNECTAPAHGKIPRVNGTIGVVDDLDLSEWRLEIVADHEDPAARHVVLNLNDLKAMPRTETATEFRCIEGWSEPMSFAGVRFADLMQALHLQPKSYVGLVSEDGAYYVSIDMESMLHPQTLLAYEMNGAPLRSENGAPLRLAIPVKYGIKNIKQVSHIFFSDHRPPDYWAERGYDWFAGL